MSETSTDLTIMERSTGELVRVSDASTLSLAAAITGIQEAQEQGRLFEDEIAAELLSRMDQQACWTLREGDIRDGEAWEIKAPSPSAGTENYPTDPLETALSDLIEAGVINERAAERALKRTVKIEIAIPWGSDPDEIVTALGQSVEVEIAGHKTTMQAASADRKTVASEIAKLRKIPGTKDLLDEVIVTSEPPRRRVKVTLKTKVDVRA